MLTTRVCCKSQRVHTLYSTVVMSVVPLESKWGVPDLASTLNHHLSYASSSV